MATDPKNPSNLRNYDDVRAQQTAAMRMEEASQGLFSRMGASIKRWATGESQLEEAGRHTPAAPKKNDHVLRWYDTGEPYTPEAEKPKNPAQLKPYAPHTSTIPNPMAVVTPADAKPAVLDLPILEIKAPEEQVTSYSVRKGDTLGSIAAQQADLRAASGLEGDSSMWAVAITTAKLNGMQSINDTIRTGTALQLPTADMVRATVLALSATVADDQKITWKEAKQVDVQNVPAIPVNHEIVSR